MNHLQRGVEGQKGILLSQHIALHFYSRIQIFPNRLQSIGIHWNPSDYRCTPSESIHRAVKVLTINLQCIKFQSDCSRENQITKKGRLDQISSFIQLDHQKSNNIFIRTFLIYRNTLWLSTIWWKP